MIVNWPVIVELVKALAWPAVALILALPLRRELRAAFGRIESAKVAGTEFAFGKSAADIPFVGAKREPARQLSSGQGDLAKVGSLYWLGHDVMWTIDVVLRDGSRSTILYGLRQSLHHLTELKLEKTSNGDTVTRLLNTIEASRDDQLNSALREHVALELRRVADIVGAIVEAEQGDFRAETTAGSRR